MNNWTYGELLQDKRSKELYIFCGTATEEDHRKYNGNPFRELDPERGEDWLLWSNKDSKFIFMAKSITHLYLKQLDTATTNDTEIN